MLQERLQFTVTEFIPENLFIKKKRQDKKSHQNIKIFGISSRQHKFSFFVCTTIPKKTNDFLNTENI